MPKAASCLLCLIAFASHAQEPANELERERQRLHLLEQANSIADQMNAQARSFEAVYSKLEPGTVPAGLQDKFARIHNVCKVLNGDKPAFDPFVAPENSGQTPDEIRNEMKGKVAERIEAEAKLKAASVLAADWKRKAENALANERGDAVRFAQEKAKEAERKATEAQVAIDKLSEEITQLSAALERLKLPDVYVMKDGSKIEAASVFATPDKYIIKDTKGVKHEVWKDSVEKIVKGGFPDAKVQIDDPQK